MDLRRATVAWKPSRQARLWAWGWIWEREVATRLDWQLHRPRHCPPSLEIARPLALKVKSRRARVRYGRIDADLMLKSSGTLQLEDADSNKSSLAHRPYTLPVLLSRLRHLACHAYTATAFIRASHVLCSPNLSQTHCTDCTSGSVQADWPVAHGHCQAQSQALLALADYGTRDALPDLCADSYGIPLTLACGRGTEAGQCNYCWRLRNF